MEHNKKFEKKSGKETLRQKAGDKLERLGAKVTKAGLPKTGKAVYNAGNKLEHSDK